MNEISNLDTQRESALFVPGRNCWRIEPARRASVLIDGDVYFRALRSAMTRARHSIFILSWDIDSRMRLVPGGANDGYPEPLGEFLSAIAAAHKDLHVHVLDWDFSMLYVLEREWRPEFKLDWQTRGRLHFHMDDSHPVGAAHHQKVVVIDDALAFVGGFDPTRCRWDTSRHAHAEPLRRDANGAGYAPFHDVQMMVDGEAALALGELARERWRRATGQCVETQPAVAATLDPWPPEVAPDILDARIAIVRTEPPYKGRPGVQEVRQFHLDAIARARHSLLFENQYFTSASVGEALRQRLGEQDGPDVVVVSARVESGWLEAATMGVLRARLHRELCSADRQGRYRMYCPHIPDLAPGCLNVHSKVMIVDDEILTIGSANLNNRSMVLDTECNLALEAGGDARVARAIARVRERLLGEHLDAAPERVAQVHAQKGRLIAAIDALRGSGRTLHPLDPVVTPEQEALLPPRAWIDPEQPMAADELVGHLVSREAGPPVARRVARLAAAALMIGLVAVAWRWTPLREWVNLSAMVGYAQHLDELPMSSLAVIAAYVVGGVLIVPVTALIAVTGIVFGPMLGVAYAIAGTLASAAATYGLGRWLGRDTVRRFAGDQINRVSRRIAQRGVLAIVIVRVVPVAPFSVINIIAGASHIRWRDFMLGTALGMTPGIVVTVTFAHQLALAIRHPSLVAIAVLAVIAAVLVALAMLLGRKLGRRGRDPG